jgi:hypothetical protein
VNAAARIRPEDIRFKKTRRLFSGFGRVLKRSSYNCMTLQRITLV